MLISINFHKGWPTQKTQQPFKCDFCGNVYFNSQEELNDHLENFEYHGMCV